MTLASCCVLFAVLLVFLSSFSCSAVDIANYHNSESDHTNRRQLIENSSSSSSKIRSAIIVTLAGPNKLSNYFEWCCRSIGYSADAFDMLVFHESNKVAKESIKCAENVKFIDLGTDGLSKLIVDKTLGDKVESVDTKNDLKVILANIIRHMPRYLIEVKPMSGVLFEEWLRPYSHWSYTDPDIVWGNLTNWITTEDYDNDILTLAKTYDASRLFIRGQFALHKNSEHVNNLWRRLSYFDPSDFATRLANANKLLSERKSADQIMAKYFHSAEGWYSHVVFEDTSIKVKISGRGFDDFNSDPVILYRGFLTSCSAKNPKELRECVRSQVESPAKDSIYNAPQIHLKDVKTYSGESACRMMWLPVSVRYCIGTDSYEKSDTSSNARHTIRMERLGESFFEGGNWKANDEMVANRQFMRSAAFFHFRHWDDYLSTSIETNWQDNQMIVAGEGSSQGTEASIEEEMKKHCMILHVTPDKRMIFEPCLDFFESKPQGNLRANRKRRPMDHEKREGGEIEREKEKEKVRERRSRSPRDGEGNSESVLRNKRREMERGTA